MLGLYRLPPPTYFCYFILNRLFKDKTVVKSFGNQNTSTSRHKDLWGQIQNEYKEGWFVPSREELVAFMGSLNILPKNVYGKSLGNG